MWDGNEALGSEWIRIIPGVRERGTITHATVRNEKRSLQACWVHCLDDALADGEITASMHRDKINFVEVCRSIGGWDG